MDTLTIETVVLPTPVYVYLCFVFCMQCLTIIVKLAALWKHKYPRIKADSAGDDVATLVIVLISFGFVGYFLFLAGY